MKNLPTTSGRIGRSGHNLFVRIPAGLAWELDIQRGDPLTILPQGRHRIVVEFDPREGRRRPTTRRSPTGRRQPPRGGPRRTRGR